MVDITMLLVIMSLGSAVLSFTAGLVMLKIAKITGKFVAWSLISASIFILGVSRLVTAYTVGTGLPVGGVFLVLLINLVYSSIMFIGLGMLYIIFKKSLAGSL